MKTHLIHPLSALAGATVILGACLLSGMQQPAGEKQDILRHMTIVWLDDGQGGTAKTIRFTGVNVQIVNGLKSTNGNPFNPDSVESSQIRVNGVGNLIVGYNELGNPLGFGDNRTGSHNIVFGHGNNYTSFGGIVGPNDCSVSGPFASVTGGRQNTASGYWTSVSGGQYNSASGGSSKYYSYAGGSVSGGYRNTASGYYASVSGGSFNTASEYASSVSGGVSNTASGDASSVSGGQNNTASGDYSSVSGGWRNVASGSYSSVSGGANRSVSGTNNWRGGKYYSNN